ncbi:MAG: hypothetical protein AB7H97_13165 [Pseudobdellovibrionaceae bacterium]
MKAFLKTALAAGLLIAALPVSAQMTAKEGFAKLHTNVENSEYNIDQYKKNLTIVDGNIKSVGQVLTQVKTQEQGIAADIKSNKSTLAEINKKEQTLKKMITTEQELMTKETAQLAELEKLMAQIRKNQELRTTNIADLQNKAQSIEAEKGAWVERDNQLKEQQKVVKARLDQLSQEDKTWKGKKRGYEGEVSRWQKELEKNQKLESTYKSLADVPTGK